MRVDSTQNIEFQFALPDMQFDVMAIRKNNPCVYSRESTVSCALPNPRNRPSLAKLHVSQTLTNTGRRLRFRRLQFASRTSDDELSMNISKLILVREIPDTRSLYARNSISPGTDRRM